MGCGKSTLGKKVAKKLDLPFFDLDKYIEEYTGVTIPEIFKAKGELHFRELETQLLTQLINNKDRYLIAVGGGTPCFNENIDLINNNGTSIYLKYNVGVLASRLLSSKAERPLIANKTKEELVDFISDLLSEREQFYNQSKIVVQGNNINSKQVLDLLF